MQWLNHLLAIPAKHQTEGYIGLRGPAVAPNQAYVTFDVAALWITHVRKGLRGRLKRPTRYALATLSRWNSANLMTVT